MIFFVLSNSVYSKPLGNISTNFRAITVHFLRRFSQYLIFEYCGICLLFLIMIELFMTNRTSGTMIYQLFVVTKIRPKMTFLMVADGGIFLGDDIIDKVFSTSNRYKSIAHAMASLSMCLIPRKPFRYES